MPHAIGCSARILLWIFTENSFIYESLTLTFLLTFHPHCISIQILILHFKSSSSNPLGPLLASALYRQTILISHRGVTFHLLINFLYGTVSQDVVIYFFMILTHLAPLFICQSIFVDFTETYSMCCPWHRAVFCKFSKFFSPI